MKIYCLFLVYMKYILYLCSVETDKLEIMKTTRISGGYKLEYKGYVRFVCRWNNDWIMYDDCDFTYGGGCPVETLREQKEGMQILIDGGYDLGDKISTQQRY